MKRSEIIQGSKKSKSVYGSDICDPKSTKLRKGDILVKILFESYQIYI